MAENDPTITEPTPSQTEPPSEPDYKALYEQFKTEARKWEDRAKSNLDKAKAYDELQAKAQQQAQANKTLEEQVAEIREQLNASTATNLRLKVASEKGIDATLLFGSTEEELRANADAMLAWREQTAPKPTAPIVPKDGNVPSNQNNPSELGEFAHNFFGGN